MSTYERSLVAARFAALAPEPVAGNWDDVLRRAAEPRPEGWDDVLHPAGAEHPSRRWTFPRWRIVFFAAVILVGGLLVTPAFGIGSSLLDLLKGGPQGQPPHRAPAVGQAGWSPDGKIVFQGRVGTPKNGQYQVYVMNPDGSGKRALLELWGPGASLLVSRRADDRFQTGQRPGLRHERPTGAEHGSSRRDPGAGASGPGRPTDGRSPLGPRAARRSGFTS
jgi:hypothetical protein